MKLVWCTDIHLNFCTKPERLAFYKTIVDSEAGAVAISGDIGESHDFKELLLEMFDETKLPIYFVLGNHDYYMSSVKEVREKLLKWTHRDIKWLNNLSPIVIKDTAIVGIDGFADTRYGNYKKSWVVLNDSNYIKELYDARRLGMIIRLSGGQHNKKALETKMKELADGDARTLETQLSQCIDRAKNIIVVTHIPPFKQACFYRGEQSDDNFLPFYSSKATGDVLKKFAKANKDINITVLCGHTHGKSLYKPLKNLTVKTGGAEYHKPQIQEIIWI